MLGGSGPSWCHGDSMTLCHCGLAAVYPVEIGTSKFDAVLAVPGFLLPAFGSGFLHFTCTTNHAMGKIIKTHPSCSLCPSW